MHIHKLLRITKGNNSHRNGPYPYIFIISIGPVDMNKYARFDKITSKTFKDIKETKRYRQRTDGQHENSIPTHKHSLPGGGGGGGGIKKMVGTPIFG